MDLYFNRKVTDFMTRDVVTVDAGEKVGGVLAKMKERGINKIVVSDHGVPRGLLDLWVANAADPDMSIHDMLRQSSFALSPIRPVTTDVTFADVRDPLSGAGALVVVDDVRSPRDICGIVTATDLFKARPKF